jgi:Uma2 family endonuclease
MPATRGPVTTIDELLALPDDGMRHELLDGEHVVTPSPAVRHQRAVGELFLALSHALADQKDVEVLSSPADIVLGPSTLVQPDLFIAVRATGGSPTWAEVGVPLLAIEVLSPSTAARDRGKKRKIYLESGVAEYWIVDLDARLVERWRSGDERPQIVDGALAWSLAGGASGSLDLPRLFDRIDRPTATQ